MFEWVKFRKHKGGIKVHTLYDVEAEVPAFVHITSAKIASRYRLSDSEMVELPDMNFHGYNQISEPPRLES